MHFYVIAPKECMLLKSEPANSDVSTHGHGQQQTTWQLPKIV
jgi:hypothetical protein